MSHLFKRLADEIIRGYFGERCTRVVDCLLTKGSLSLSAISINLRLHAKHVKEAIIVLIHHNIILYEEKLNQVFYHIQMDRIIMLLAIPHHVCLIEDFYQNSEAAQLVIECGKYGRLSIEHVSEGKIHLLKQMLDDEIFSLVDPSDSKYKTSLNMDQYATKRKIEYSSDNFTSFSNQGFYVMINIEKFKRMNQDYAILELAKELIGEHSVIVMRCLLRQSSGVMLTCNQIAALLPKDFQLPIRKDNESRKSSIQIYLEHLMIQLGEGIVKRIDYSEDKYFIDRNAIWRILQDNALKAFISSKWGERSIAVYNILYMKGFLEDKAIMNLAMMTGKETRERLYQLLQDNLIQMQEIPRTLDHAPTRTYFLWNVDLVKAVIVLQKRILQTVCNYMERIQHEKNRNLLLSQKLERAISAGVFDDLNANESKKFQQVRKCIFRLEHYVSALISEYFLTVKEAVNISSS